MSDNSSTSIKANVIKMLRQGLGPAKRSDKVKVSKKVRKVIK